METSANIGTSNNFLKIGHMWSSVIDTNMTEYADVNEAIVGAGLRLSDRWSLRWNAIYNMQVGEFQRHNGGVYYNHPCYFVSVEYQHDNAIKKDYVGTTTFQFRFGMAIEGKPY